jgi:rare lipoprotein A
MGDSPHGSIGKVRGALIIACVLGLAILAGCAGKQTSAPAPGGKPGKVFQKGVASWYGNEFHGRQTASGERYDQWGMTAAHKTLPFQTWVEVHNLENGRTVKVRINDRGPFVHGRIIDLSRGAADRIGMPGIARVELRLLGKEPAPEPAAEKPKRKETRKEPAPDLEPVDPGSGEFLVQVGSFGVKANAERLREELRRDWPRVRVVKFREFYRVQVGPYRTRGEAEKARDRLARSMEVPPVVVRQD